MNRKEFFRSCAGGLCACGVAGLAAAETPKKEDWRLTFVQARYGKLLENLSRRMDGKELNDVLLEAGTYCSSRSDDWTKKYRGDFEGLAKTINQGLSGDTVTYDREKGIVTMDSGVRSECFCPFNCKETPAVVCNCSLGWQKHTWETFFQKKVTVELKESVLRGGKRCLFEIHVSDNNV